MALETPLYVTRTDPWWVNYIIYSNNSRVIVIEISAIPNLLCLYICRCTLSCTDSDILESFDTRSWWEYVILKELVFCLKAFLSWNLCVWFFWKDACWNCLTNLAVLILIVQLHLRYQTCFKLFCQSFNYEVCEV